MASNGSNIKSYQDLEVWKKAMDLTLTVYKATAQFPKEETYGLVSQMRRAAVSIPSNIAEGQARSSKDFKRFLSISLGSLFELETQAELSSRLKYMPVSKCKNLVEQTGEVARMIRGLSAKLPTSH